MEGPLLVHASWIFTLAFVWIYHRYFRTIAPRSPELEKICAERPLLATLSVRPGTEGEVAQRLERRIGKRSEVVTTLAAWPWTVHALKLRVDTAPGAVRLTIDRCRVLRTRDELPSLTNVLLDAIEPVPECLLDSWLHPAAYSDTRGQEPPFGWRLVPENGRKRPCVALETAAPAS